MSKSLQKVHLHYLSHGKSLKKTKEMALLSVILYVSHMKKENPVLMKLRQSERRWSSQI
jgi:hypothetical protein